MFGLTPFSDVAFNSSLEMERRSNGEIFSITLSVQPCINITLELQK